MDPETEKIIADLIVREGGLVSDPDDRGGMTKFGISQRAHPELDIPNLTKEEAKQVYFEDYWVGGHVNRVPAGW